MRKKLLVISAGEAYQTVFIDLYIKFLGGKKLDARYMGNYEDYSFNDGSLILVDKVLELNDIEPNEFFGFLSLCNVVYFADASLLTREDLDFAKLSKEEKLHLIDDELQEHSLVHQILAQFSPGEIVLYGAPLTQNSKLFPSNALSFTG